MKIKPGTGLAKRPVPSLPSTDVTGPVNPVKAGDGYRIVMPGIGGTGVLTINALLATAATLEGKQVLTLDQTGLAQKGGAVVSSIVIADRAIEASARVNAGNADLILGFDLLGVMSAETAKCAHPSRTVAVINTQLTPTHDSIRHPRDIRRHQPHLGREGGRGCGGSDAGCTPAEDRWAGHCSR